MPRIAAVALCICGMSNFTWDASRPLIEMILLIYLIFKYAKSS